jgi:transposase
MHTYSQDLRDRVVQACDAGQHSKTYLAQLFGVSTAWIRRLLQRRRDTGSYAAKARGGSRTAKLDANDRGRLLVLVREQPDATLAELRDRLAAPVHLTTIHRATVRLGLTVKKKSSGPPNRTARTSAASGPSFAAARPRSTRTGSSSSMKSGLTRP